MGDSPYLSEQADARRPGGDGFEVKDKVMLNKDKVKYFILVCPVYLEQCQFGGYISHSRKLRRQKTLTLASYAIICLV